MNDHDTSVLTARLHRLADDMAPPLDVVGQVRAARARHQKQRRSRFALLAAATATAAVVVGSVAAADLLTVTPSRGEVAVPSTPAPTTTEALPTTSPPPPAETTGLPAGWEPRSFLGMTFAVPPGARMADYVNEAALPEPGIGPEFIWNGPSLGGDFYAHIKISLQDGDEGDLEPMAEFDPVTIPGADQAYAVWEQSRLGDGAGSIVQTTSVLIDMLAGDQHVHLGADFVGGPQGEQMARDLIASLDLTEMESGLSGGSEPRSFQGVTFTVPPGARMADTVDTSPATSFMDGPSLTWNGPQLTAESYSFVKVRITDTWEGGLTPLDGGDWFTVPGAEQAYGGIDTVDYLGDPTDTTTLWMHLLDGDRQIVVSAEFPAGETGRQMAEDLIASLAVS